jgi:predicted RND superfamily exporter protein
VEVLPEDLVDDLVRVVREREGDLGDPGVLRAMEQRIVASGVMDPEDAGFTVEGLAARVASARRVQGSERLLASLRDLLPDDVRRNAHFEKRAMGVLWSLLGDRPFFFSRQLAAVPGAGDGVVSTRELEIYQSGFPEIIGRLEAVLVKSQYVSLFLASVAVFVLVSLTQFSLRRGLASLLSVLVPMELVLGIMGWFDIPLDFGTVLSGALVVGLGIDGSIHFLHYYHHLREEGVERKEALQASLGHVGRAVVTANATTCSGFLILLFAHTSAVRNFALTCGVAIILVTLSILTFLPALLVLLGLANERQVKPPPTS